MSTRTTSEIAEKFNLELVGGDASISEVAIGTQHIRQGALFIAVQGKRSHGIEFLQAARESGAVAVLTDAVGNFQVPTLRAKDPRAIAGLVADYVYGTSASRQSLYGVTGTNGKTSTVFFLSELLNALGEKCGLISSALVQSGGEVLPSELTTPEAPRVHQLLAQMRAVGQNSCAVEVSAQGLTRDRVRGLKFRVAGFSNLSRDHLDDYPDMETYLAAKAQLFTASYAEKAVVMVEDKWAEQLFSQITIPKVGIGRDYHYVCAPDGIAVTGLKSLQLRVQVPELMAKNLVLATVMLLESGYDPQALEAAVVKINLQVPGRLEKVSDHTPHVFVDYAHTPAAVEAAAHELKSKYPSLTILLAASGDRDQGKRAEMAIAAAKYANQIVITDQHPRSEDPAAIRSQLKAAIASFPGLYEVADPAAAIELAVKITDAGGAILWCGPGHLKYREVQGQKLPFDAVAQARKVLDHD